MQFSFVPRLIPGVLLSALFWAGCDRTLLTEPAGGRGGESLGGEGLGGAEPSGGGGETSCTPGIDCLCSPGELQPCYTGRAGTEHVGLCSPGFRTCDASGQSFGDCEGEVTPSPESCGVIGDEDCDGQTNEEGADCACVPGSRHACYSADPTTQDVGPCTGGTQTCDSDGLGYGPCEGEVVPVVETCNTGLDDDCDGETNEDGEGCVCEPNSITSCYSGPPEAAGVGICQEGTQICNEQGTALSPCTGEVFPKQESCAAPADEDCDGSALACTGDLLWVKRFGNSEHQRGIAATDSNGNVIVSARTQGSLDFGGGALAAGPNYDLAIAKFDPSGSHLWSKLFNGADDQWPNAVAADAAGNVLVFADIQGTVDFGGGAITPAGSTDTVLVKFDPSGAHLWSKRFGNAAGLTSGYGIATDAAGNVYITGVFSGTNDFGGGPLTSADHYDIFVAKLDPAGNHLWSKRFGGTNGQWSRKIAMTPGGNIVVVGDFYNTLDFGGGPLSSAGLSDIFIAMLDNSGNHIWSKRFGNATSQEAFDVAIDGAGDIVEVGRFWGNIDFGGGSFVNNAAGVTTDGFVAKFDASGNHLWSKQLAGGTNDQVAATVAIDAFANVIIGGHFKDSIGIDTGLLVGDGVDDAFVAKLDASGNHLWSRAYGGIDYQRVDSVDVDMFGNVLVGGQFFDAIDLGNGPLTSAGASDIFLAKLAP